MDFRHIVTNDEDLLMELIERQAELGALEGGSSLESSRVEGGTEALHRGLEQMREGTYSPGESAGIEAIILRFTRPVFLVQDSTVVAPADSATILANGESKVITDRLTAAKSVLDAAIPRVGRISLANHRLDSVGTGWIVHPNVAVTNRHVATYFAARARDGFPFRSADRGRAVKASIDWRREYGRQDESIVQVEEVLWISPDSGPDMALLRVRGTDDEGNPSPEPIRLMTQAEVDASVLNWVAVIGYPVRSPVTSDLADQKRIFDGIYDVKRVAPGTVTAVSSDGVLTHDATTLSGNSGSVVLDLDTGHAVGLHFRGFEGEQNWAVQAPVIAARIAEHA